MSLRCYAIAVEAVKATGTVRWIEGLSCARRGERRWVFFEEEADARFRFFDASCQEDVRAFRGAACVRHARRL